MSHLPSKNDALWAIVTQLLIIVIFSTLIGMKWGRKASGSFGIGGLICMLPNIYLYKRVFAHFGAHAAQKIVKALYWGEAVKILFTAVGFVGALFIPWLLPLWLFVGYIATQGGFWVAPIVLGLIRAKK
jgi:ATP synthase protein I